MNKLFSCFLIIGLFSVILTIFPTIAFSDCSCFENGVNMGLLEHSDLIEASGIAASVKNPGVLWTHNDSGNPNQIFAINENGTHLGLYTIQGAASRDWEDIALGPGPLEGKSYIYIGDIGDNGKINEDKYIYRVLEPAVDAGQSPVTITLSNVETITYQYPDGKWDAETLMIDPLTKDIYIGSKSTPTTKVYVAEYPQSTTTTLTLQLLGELGITAVTGGDISQDGSEILIKDYFFIYHWFRYPGETVWDALSRTPKTVPYTIVLQGEAVCFNPETKGYYTVNEEYEYLYFHFYPSIYRYDRIPLGDLDGVYCVDLKDAIIGQKVLAAVDGVNNAIRDNYPDSGADVNGDGRIDSWEVLYILQCISDLP